MKITVALSLLALWLGVYAKAADYIVITSDSAESILAQPLKLDGDKVMLLRNDGLRFEVPLTRFSASSQIAIKQYLVAQLAVPQPSLNPAPAPAPVHQTQPAATPQPTRPSNPPKENPDVARDYVLDQPLIFTHGDYGYHPFKDREKKKEMEIISITVERKSLDVISFRLVFAEDIPRPPKYSYPYRIWLALDLDDNPATGADNKGSFGQDFSLAINGGLKSSSWDSYIVDKTNGQKIPAPSVNRIRYNSATLSFEVKCKGFKPGAAFRFQISTCANAVNTVDLLPAGYGNAYRCILPERF